MPRYKVTWRRVQEAEAVLEGPDARTVRTAAEQTDPADLMPEDEWAVKVVELPEPDDDVELVGQRIVVDKERRRARLAPHRVPPRSRKR